MDSIGWDAGAVETESHDCMGAQDIPWGERKATINLISHPSASGISNRGRDRIGVKFRMRTL